MRILVMVALNGKDVIYSDTSWSIVGQYQWLGMFQLLNQMEREM